MTKRTLWQILDAVSIATVILMVVVFISCLTGCGTRLTDGQAAQLAQARADIQAGRSTSDATAANDLLHAAAARTMSAVADLSLPEPLTAPSALIAKDGAPDSAAIKVEHERAAAAEQDPPSGWAGTVLAWAGGAGLLVLGAMRFSPGIFGVVADLAHQFLAPLATRQMRERQVQGAQIAEQAVAYGAAVTDAARAAGLGEEIRDIQVAAAEVQDRLGIREQTRAILAQFKNPTPIRESSNSG